MWWERNACGPRARQNVLFSSAPQPSTGAADGRGQRQRLGGVAAGAADRQHAAALDPDDGVVGAGVDGAVVVEDGVGDRPAAASASR